MDESTISDIRQRVNRWTKGLKNGKESERTWIFAVNIDDVELMLATIARLEVDNESLRLVIMGMRESISPWEVGVDPAVPDGDTTVIRTPNGSVIIPDEQIRKVTLDASAIEPSISELCKIHDTKILDQDPNQVEDDDPEFAAAAWRQYLRQGGIEPTDHWSIAEKNAFAGNYFGPLHDVPLPPKLDDHPTGEPAYWFEVNTGVYIANDIPQQRAHRFSRGPFATREEADSKWREYLKEQKAQRKP